MAKDEVSPLADWAVINARWIFLVWVILWLALGVGFPSPTGFYIILLLVLGVIGNILLTLAIISNQRIPFLRPASVMGEFIAIQTLFYLTAPIGAELSWIGLMPLISAAFYFSYIGAAVVLILNLIVQGVIAWSVVPAVEVVRFVAFLFPLYLVVGFASAYFGQRFLQRGKTGKKPYADMSLSRSEQERRRAIYNLISELSASLSYQRTIETALDLSANTLMEVEAPTEDLVSMVLFFGDVPDKGPMLEIVASRLLLPADTHMNLPGASGILGNTVDEGVPTLSTNISKDPELSQFVSLRGYQSAYCIPLRSGLDAYGVMLFSHPDAAFFTSERREVLDIIGKQFVITIQNARLYKDLEQEKERMLEIQEDARKKMARDLHDGPTQSIAAIAMRVNFARRLMERDTASASEELYKIEELARRTTKEIRHMLFTLRPLVLESQGLLAALESMAEKMKDTYDQNVVIQVDKTVVKLLEAGKQAVVFYLAEEAVNNARKHAKAERVFVRLKMIRPGLSLLEIEDNGVGFDVKEVDSAYEDRGSLGMVNMRERTELINGAFHIDSAVGRGTRVRIAIPLTDEAAERLRRGA